MSPQEEADNLRQCVVRMCEIAYKHHLREEELLARIKKLEEDNERLIKALTHS